MCKCAIAHSTPNKSAARTHIARTFKYAFCTHIAHVRVCARVCEFVFATKRLHLQFRKFKKNWYSLYPLVDTLALGLILFSEPHYTKSLSRYCAIVISMLNLKVCRSKVNGLPRLGLMSSSSSKSFRFAGDVVVIVMAIPAERPDAGV